VLLKVKMSNVKNVLVFLLAKLLKWCHTLWLSVMCALAKIFLLHFQVLYIVICNNKCDAIIKHKIETNNVCTQCA
jgi:hypothetical protein